MCMSGRTKGTMKTTIPFLVFLVLLLSESGATQSTESADTATSGGVQEQTTIITTPEGHNSTGPPTSMPRKDCPKYWICWNSAFAEEEDNPQMVHQNYIIILSSVGGGVLLILLGSLIGVSVCLCKAKSALRKADELHQDMEASTPNGDSRNGSRQNSVKHKSEAQNKNQNQNSDEYGDVDQNKKEPECTPKSDDKQVAIAVANGVQSKVAADTVPPANNEPEKTSNNTVLEMQETPAPVSDQKTEDEQK